MYLDRIYKFVSQNYGAMSGTKFRQALDEGRDAEGRLTDEARNKLKEMFQQILTKEIVKTYKIPNAVSFLKWNFWIKISPNSELFL